MTWGATGFPRLVLGDACVVHQDVTLHIGLCLKCLATRGPAPTAHPYERRSPAAIRSSQGGTCWIHWDHRHQ